MKVTDASAFMKKNQEVKDAIAKVKTSKSFRTGDISGYFLKLALLYINNGLVYMFNKSIEKRQFPAHWKVARTTHIFKYSKS